MAVSGRSPAHGSCDLTVGFAAFTTIDVPGASLTFPLGINDCGYVVGMYRDANQVGHGFLYRDGAFTTIYHRLGSSDSWTQDVNDRGQIVGFYERDRSDSAVDARSGVASASVPARWPMWGPKRLG
jgi:probable HAF family extracellular repeat protein